MKQHHRRGLYAPELLEARIAPATFVVTNLLDTVVDTDGTLRHAISAANLLIGADTIVFKLADPLLPHTILLNGTEIPITDTLTIKGPGVDLLTVSGGDLSRIFNITDGTAALKPTTISGLTLTDGKSTAAGGAILSVEPVSLTNVVIRNSEATGNGGAMKVDTTGKISLVNSRIVHNTAGPFGGGLYLSGNVISLVKTTIADNTSTSIGGLYAESVGTKAVVIIDSCIIANNVASSHTGGVGIDGSGDGKVIVKNSLITGNKATGSFGGLYLDGGNLTVTNTTFSNNSGFTGGALAASNSKSVTVSGSRFLGNKSTNGTGGGALWFDDAGLVKITGSLFSGNTAVSDGGAITALDSSALTVTGSTFLGNSAGSSGGAFNIGDGAVLTMKSSILSGNSAGSGGGAIYGYDGAVLNLTGSKFTENRAAGGGGALYLKANAVASTATLSGNLFQANVAGTIGGAIRAVDNCIFTSKADKFIGNLAVTGQGGGVHLVNTGGILITGSLFQGNIAGSSGGGLGIGSSATLTGIKVLDNIAGAGGIGGGLRISGGAVMILKSIITGNIADRGGGILFTVGTTTMDAATKVIGNAARTDPNIGTI